MPNLSKEPLPNSQLQESANKIGTIGEQSKNLSLKNHSLTDIWTGVECVVHKSCKNDSDLLPLN